jgi:hypothetical protein
MVLPFVRNSSFFREILGFGTPEKFGELCKNESRIIENRERGVLYTTLSPVNPALQMRTVSSCVVLES